MKPRYVRKLMTLSLAAIALGGCMHHPWYKAEYVPNQASFEYGRHCDPAVRTQLAHLYVNDHFIHVRLIGSNRTTRTETPPYRLLVSATSYTLDEGYMRIHGIEVSTTRGEQYAVEGMQAVLNIADAGATALPSTVPLSEGNLINFCAERRMRGVQPVSQAFAATDHIFDLSPEDGETISVDVDVEIQQAGKRERLTIRYLLRPEVTQGRFIPLTV